MKRRSLAEYLRWNKVLMYLSGILPFKSQNVLINSFFIAWPFVSSGFLCIPAFYSFCFGGDRITKKEKMGILSEELEMIVAVIKVGILIPKRDKLYGLTKSCSKLWEKVVSDDDSSVVGVHANRGFVLTCGFMFTGLIGTGSFLITPMFASSFVLDDNGTVLVSKRLPYTAGVFHENVNLYYIWYAVQVPTAYETVVALIAVDLGVAVFVFHASGHMRLCRALFVRIAEDFKAENPLLMTDTEWTTRRKKFFDDIVECSTYHRDILAFAQDIEEIFTNANLVQILVGLVAICNYTYGALVSDSDEVPKLFVHVWAVSFQLLLYCYPPDVLQDESFMMADAAYNLPWYNWTSREGTLVTIIIARSQIPVTITAGKFKPITLETFAWIMETAFSMLTLLLNVME